MRKDARTCTPKLALGFPKASTLLAMAMTTEESKEENLHYQASFWIIKESSFCQWQC